MELRPLGFGEIFDRAVTLYIRNFVPFAVIVGVLIVPVAVLQYFLDVAAQPQFDAMFQIFTHPGQTPAQPIPSAFSSPAYDALFVAMILITYAIWPFTLNAVAVGVARLYRNQPVEFRACYQVVLGRWRQILGMIGLEFLVFLAWYVALVVLIVVFALVAASVSAIAPTAVFWVAFTIGLVGFFVLLPTLAPLVIALTFSMYAVVIEQRPVVESLVLGFARVFNKREFWRSVLFAVAVFAVILGASAILSFIAMFAAVAHLPLLETAVDTVSRALITPFGVVLLAIYYFDVRIRREAFDLEASLERLTAAQPA